jgi:fungalysin metallopeptidase (M36)/peptidase YpeB-like protein
MVAKKSTVRAKVEMDPRYKVPRRFYDVDEPVSKGDPREVAEAFLRKAADDLQINPDLSGLRFDQVKESVLGNHALFQQQHGGRPVTGAWVRVDVDPAGKIFNVQSDLIPESVLSKAKAPATLAGSGITDEEAIAKALAATGSTSETPHTIHSTEQVAYPVDGQPAPAWKVVVIGDQPLGEWKVYVDAASGAVLGVVSLLKEAHGRIFDPHPVATLNDTTLEDTSAILDPAYTEVELVGLDGSGHLDGLFVSTANTPARVQRNDGEFLFKRADRPFKEVMVYFHIDRVQRYLQELGFTNVLNGPIKVNIVGRTDDNSDYSPVTKALRFGTGGVDDAEDAEIILHEYGHAIQDNQVPGFGASNECGAMGEGFGDYLAGSFFANGKPARLQPCVGSWDAVSYSGDDPPSLRRLDSNKKYPRDVHGEVHDDGEIWSACLWEIRTALGGPTADKLIIAHHFLLTPNSTFEDAANALITTDQQLNDGRNVEVLRDVFVRRGILPNPKRKNRRAGFRFDDIRAEAAKRRPRRTVARSRGR